MLRHRDIGVMLLGLFLMLSALGVSIGQAEETTPVSDDEQRVVSFSPAVTQMIVDLGAADRMVGVGAYDPAAPPGVAVIGHLHQIDYEKLLRAEPTDVFMQITAQATPARLRKLAARHGWELHRYRIDTAADALLALHHAGRASDDRANREAVGEALGLAKRAKRLAGSVRGRLADLERLTKPLPAIPTLMIVGRNPVTAVGPSTFLNEMLVAAGGENVLDDADALYPVLGKEDLLRLDPELLLLIEPDAGGAKTTTRREPSRPPGPAPHEANRARRVVIHDATALLPSTTMDRVAAEFARRLHPDKATLRRKIDALFDSDARE